MAVDEINPREFTTITAFVGHRWYLYKYAKFDSDVCALSCRPFFPNGQGSGNIVEVILSDVNLYITMWSTSHDYFTTMWSFVIIPFFMIMTMIACMD